MVRGDVDVRERADVRRTRSAGAVVLLSVTGRLTDVCCCGL